MPGPTHFRHRTVKSSRRFPAALDVRRSLRVADLSDREWPRHGPSRARRGPSGRSRLQAFLPFPTNRARALPFAIGSFVGSARRIPAARVGVDFARAPGEPFRSHSRRARRLLRRALGFTAGSPGSPRRERALALLRDARRSARARSWTNLTAGVVPQIAGSFRRPSARRRPDGMLSPPTGGTGPTSCALANETTPRLRDGTRFPSFALRRERFTPILRLAEDSSGRERRALRRHYAKGPSKLASGAKRDFDLRGARHGARSVEAARVCSSREAADTRPRSTSARPAPHADEITRASAVDAGHGRRFPRRREHGGPAVRVAEVNDKSTSR